MQTDHDSSTTDKSFKVLRKKVLAPIVYDKNSKILSDRVNIDDSDNVVINLINKTTTESVPDDNIKVSVIYPSKSLRDRIDQSKIRILSAIARPTKGKGNKHVNKNVLSAKPKVISSAFQVFQSVPESEKVKIEPLTIGITSKNESVKSNVEQIEESPGIKHIDTLEAPGPNHPNSKTSTFR